MEHRQKPVIYQLLPRLYTNYCEHPVPNGSIATNGCGKLNGITDEILRNIKDLGVTHVWYTGVIEHSHDADYTRYGISRNNPHVVKGKAGSPYAITDYYDIDPDLAEDVEHRIDEFERLVERTHRQGMRVIIDFVPNHVAREYHSDAKPRGIEDFGAGDDTEMMFSPRNDFYYITRQLFSPSVSMGSGSDAYIEFPAKASGNDCFTAFPGVNDWYDTVKLNYGIDYGNGTRHFDPVPPVWLKMLHILRYWASKGIDGFRCDMVHMVPTEFWHWAIPQVKETYPDVVFIAEIYEVGLYRPYIYHGGFDYLYDKVTLYDTLRGIECGNVSAAALTSCWQTVDGINSRMLNFLENHDKQRFASEQYAGDAWRVVPSLVVSAMINTGAMMIYGGQELGERADEAEGYSGRDGRTTIFDYWSIPTVRQWLNGGRCDGELSYKQRRLRELYRKVLTMCNSEEAVQRGLFFDLMYVNYDNPGLNPHRQYAFMRGSERETLLIVVNFDTEEREVSVKIPRHAFEYLKLNEGSVKARELLKGTSAVKELSSSRPFVTMVGGRNAVIWKIVNEDIGKATAEPRRRKSALADSAPTKSKKK